jgi:DNA replication protein DnaC
LDPQQQLDLMEIIEDRHAKASTIIASQLPVASWYDVIGQEPTVSDAILDRLVHTAFRITLQGYDNNLIMECVLHTSRLISLKQNFY